MPADCKHRFHPAALALLLLLAVQKPAGAQSVSPTAQSGSGTTPSSTAPAQPPKIPLIPDLYLALLPLRGPPRTPRRRPPHQERQRRTHQRAPAQAHRSLARRMAIYRRLQPAHGNLDPRQPGPDPRPRISRHPGMQSQPGNLSPCSSKSRPGARARKTARPGHRPRNQKRGDPPLARTRPPNSTPICRASSPARSRLSA